MSNGLDAPVPSEQPPAKQKITGVVLPGAYLEEFTSKAGKNMRKVVYPKEDGDITCLLFDSEQVEETEAGLKIPAKMLQPYKGKSRWSTAAPPFDVVDAPVLVAGQTTIAAQPAKPAPAKQEEAKGIDFKKLLKKNPPPPSETAEAEAEKPAEKFDEEDAIRNFHSYFPSPADFDAYEKMADWMIKRGYGILEYSKKSKEQQQMELELQLMFCKDLNIPPSFAKSLYIVNGKPEMQIDLMMYLIARGCPTAEIEPISYTKEKVSMRARRNRTSPWITATWTIDDAKANVKGFEKKDVWKNMPAQMLRSRVLGELGRTVFYPELRGLAYVAGEISDNAPVDDKALPTPPTTPPKKSFPVKMPAKEEPPVVPYSTASPGEQAQADQNEADEVEAILNEPMAEDDPVKMMNALKDLANKERPREQQVGLPVIKKKVDALCKVSALTPTDQAKALLEMDWDDAKTLLGF